MNPKLDFIFRRRSVRTFKPKPVPEEAVRDLLEAAMAAPSACAKDPWRFIVVRDRKTLRRMTEALPNGRMLTEAALGIVVLGDLHRAHDRMESYLIQDLSAAIENILLAAPALGLGAVWLGIHPREERMRKIRELFAVPEPVIPLAAVAIGVPDDDPAPRTRYRADAVHAETFASREPA